MIVTFKPASIRASSGTLLGIIQVANRNDEVKRCWRPACNALPKAMAKYRTTFSLDFAPIRLFSENTDSGARNCRDLIERFNNSGAACSAESGGECSPELSRDGLAIWTETTRERRQKVFRRYSSVFYCSPMAGSKGTVQIFIYAYVDVNAMP